MPDTNLPPLGIFGGTFDPVHLGHLRMAEEAREALKLAEVLWIPAGAPPHRAPPRTDAQQRLEMVRLATASNPGFTVSDHEVEAAEPSYTVYTLERLRQKMGSRSLVLLLGADAFTGFSGWHHWQQILELVHIAVLHRPGFPLGQDKLPPALAAEFSARTCQQVEMLASSPAGKIISVPMTQLDISATQIRQILTQGKSPLYLLSDPVLDYIKQHQLYKRI